MNRKLFLTFLKDRLEFILGYFAGTSLVILFYSLSSAKEIEILYPLGIASFVFVVIMLIQWFSTASFLRNIERYGTDPYYHIKVTKQEQKRIAAVIEEIHRKYLRQIEQNQTEKQDFRQYVSQWVHNLKTPVSVIDIIAQKLSAGESATETLFEDIRTENHKILEGLDQILNMTRLEDFSRDYQPEPVDLAELSAEGLFTIMHIAGRRLFQDMFLSQF